jgi:hypothetical protein
MWTVDGKSFGFSPDEAVDLFKKGEAIAEQSQKARMAREAGQKIVQESKTPEGLESKLASQKGLSKTDALAWLRANGLSPEALGTLTPRKFTYEVPAAGHLDRSKSERTGSFYKEADLRGLKNPAPSGPGVAPSEQSIPAQPGEQAPPVSEAAPGRKPRLRRGISAGERFDRETAIVGPDILDWIRDFGGMMSKSVARAQGPDKWKLIAPEYDDSAPLSAPHHNKMYGGGSKPDQIAQAAYEAQQLREPSVPELWAAIKSASARRAGAVKEQARQERMLKMEEEQDVRWLEAAKKGKIEVTTEDLSVGDVLEVEGEKVRVKARDPKTGELELDDGRKFGTQRLAEGKTIYVENLTEGPQARTEFLPPEKPTLELAKPESVEEQKVRLKAEQEDRLANESKLKREEAAATKQREERARATSRIGGDLGTAGQGELLPTPGQQEIFQPRTKPVAPVKTPLDLANTDAQAKFTGPEGATMIRATDSKGRSSVQPIKDLNKRNTLVGADIVKLEAGTINKERRFQPMDGEVKVEPADPGAAPEVQGAIATPGPPLMPAAVPVPTLTPKSQRIIISDLAKGLQLPIRFGRLRTTKFGGYFLKVANLIGSKRANDVPIVTHEAGHKLDSQFGLSSMPALRGELDNLGDPALPGSRSSWTPSKTRRYRLSEGVAEFLRHWLTDPPAATRLAPNTVRVFENILSANKDVGDVLRQARDDIQVWRNAEPQARLRSHISVGENPNKTRYTVSDLTRDVVDDLHFLRLATDDAQRLSSRILAPSDNPYLLARSLRGSYGMADTFIRHGITDFKTKAVQLGTSLSDALRPVAGRINDFRDWIVAKQAQELHHQGKQTGLVNADVDFVVSRFDSDPAFQAAFTKLKTWNDAVLQYAVDAGLVTPEGAAAMRAMNQDYVPFHRVFEVGAGEPLAVEGAGTGRGLNVGKPGSLRRRTGSSRDIVDPLETMVRNAYTVITASEKSAINTAVAKFAESPGMGKWVEHIATPKEMVRVGLEKVRKQLEDEGADLTAVPDDLLMQFFQNSKHAPFGENVVRILRNGKPEYYRLKRELFEAFHALDLDDSGKLVQILSSPAQLLRAGVTLSPDFALANALRDTFSAAVISKYNAFPFETTLKGVAALIRDPKLVAEWKAAGGENAIEATYFDRTKLQNFLKEKITKDLTPAERALVVAKSPLVALRWLTGLSETATRLGEYKKAYDSLRRSGMPEGDARRRAAFDARDRQDFAKGGAKTKIIRHMSAFWNAALQANVRLVQAFRVRPVATTLKGLAFITIPKLIEQAVNWDDKDYWDRPQWERDLFFLIPTGRGTDGHTRFIRIPVPFEPGIIFGTFPGRLLQFAREKNPEVLKTFPSQFLSQSVPNPLPQTVQTLFADFLSGKKGWDIFRGRQVVPEREAALPPEMQWTEQTSLTARKLGKLLNFSPMKIDHIIQGTTGGLGKLTTHQLLDRAIAAFTDEKTTAKGVMPGGRFITTPAAVGSQAIDSFYKTLEAMRQESAGVKAGRATDMNLSLLPRFEQASRIMADWRRAALKATDERAKTELRERIVNQARALMDQYSQQRATSQ